VRRTLERELTGAIVRGELPDGAEVRALTSDDGGIELQVVQTAPQPVAA
jgi:hypothetical protein